MKKSILLAFGCLLLLQQSLPAQDSKRDEQTALLMKSYRMKKTGTALTVGGGTLMVAGLIVAATSASEFTFWGPPEDQTGLSIGGICMLAGGGLLLAGIPFYISANKHKQKAMQITVGKTLLPQIDRRSFVYRAFPSLRMTLNL